MKTLDLNLVHFIGNRVITVAGQTIDAGPHQEVRPELLGSAEKLEDVAFAIADMNAPPRLSEQFRRLLHVLQPPGWHEVIGEPTLADAILDRIVHNAFRLELDGPSMRKLKADEATELTTSPATTTAVDGKPLKGAKK